MKSFLVGWKARKGSSSPNEEQMSAIQPDLIKLGGEAMFKVSGLQFEGDWEYVAF